MYRQYLEFLAEEIVGQPEALRAFARAAVRASDARFRGGRPLGSLLVAGPVGSGKRYLMEALARLLLGSEQRALKFNPGFHEQAGPCAAHLWSLCAEHDAGWPGGPPAPRLLLVEALERASPSVTDLFVHILANGELAPAPGVRIDFRRTLLLFETGVAEVPDDDSPVGFKGGDPDAIARADAKLAAAIQEKVWSAFPPRLLSLIDEVVCFRKIRDNDLPFLLDKFLRQLQRQLGPLGLLLHVEDAAREFLLEQGRRSLRFGAKGLRQAVDRCLEMPLVDLLATRPLPRGGVIFARRSLEGVALFLPVEVSPGSWASPPAGRPSPRDARAAVPAPAG